LLLASTSLMTHPKFAKPIGLYGVAIAILSLILELTISGPITEWLTVFGSLGYVGLLIYNTLELQSR
jgi:hypothetical protein